MVERRNGAYIRVTWLSKLMADSNPCWWSVWFRANYWVQARPTDPQFVIWRAQHTRQVRELTGALKKPGVLVNTEDANFFRYTTNTGATVAGKPDIVAVQDNMVSIYDVKTGKRRDSDVLQVMLYMLLLPRARGTFREHLTQGYVVYTDGRVEISPDRIDGEFGELFEYFAGVVSGPDAPEKAPSQTNCRFCEVAASDCPEGAAVLRSAESVLDEVA